MGQTRILPKNEVLRITGVSGKQYKTIQWHGAQIVIRQFLDMSNFIATVHAIIDDCSDPDGNISKELIDFATKLHIIAAYSFVELPDDLEQLYYITYASDLYEVIVKNANSSQIEAIINTAQSYMRR